jgi:hypothetical protein
LICSKNAFEPLWRDRSEVVDQFAVGHADPGVRERDGFGLIVRRNGDLERCIG